VVAISCRRCRSSGAQRAAGLSAPRAGLAEPVRPGTPVGIARNGEIPPSLLLDEPLSSPLQVRA
jgi:hypothetical protein